MQDIRNASSSLGTSLFREGRAKGLKAYEALASFMSEYRYTPNQVIDLMTRIPRYALESGRRGVGRFRDSVSSRFLKSRRRRRSRSRKRKRYSRR